MTEKTDTARISDPQPPFDIDAVVASDRRLSVDDALWLYHHATLHQLGRWADRVARRLHGDEIRTYVIDRNINYSNVCSADCTFCAFKRDLGESDSYVLNREQLHRKMQELVDIGGTQILLQGGMHPELPLAWYEDMLRGMKEAFPQVHIHGFSPPEFVEFVAVLELDGFPATPPKQSHTLPEDVWQAKLEAVMRRLMAAGLDSLPGGGAEIFPEHVRRRIGLGKATSVQWLDVMSCAHRLGLNTSATMMFGHIEGVIDRIEHMRMVRDRQDLALRENWPGRYMSFIAWPFQRENTPLGHVPDWDPQTEPTFPGDALAELVRSGAVDGQDRKACVAAAPGAGKVVRMVGASEYLRMQAISRLFLDNIHSIGSSWVTMGPKIGQLAMFYGASDMGSVMMEENVVSAAGTTYCLDEALLCRLIRDSGFTPAQRGNRYELLRIHDGPDSPDLRVTDWSAHRVDRLRQETGQGDPDTLTDAGAIHLPLADARPLKADVGHEATGGPPVGPASCQTP